MSTTSGYEAGDMFPDDDRLLAPYQQLNERSVRHHSRNALLHSSSSSAAARPSSSFLGVGAKTATKLERALSGVGNLDRVLSCSSYYDPWAASPAHSSFSSEKGLAPPPDVTSLNDAGMPGAGAGAADPGAVDENGELLDTTDSTGSVFRGHEGWMMLSIAAPVALSFLCRSTMFLVDVAVLGRINTDYLAGAALANVWMKLTSTFWDYGIGGAVGTMCGQAYGAKNYRLVGLYVQQALVWTLMGSLPVAGLWLMTGHVLRLVGVSREQSELAAEFAYWSLFKLLPVSVYYVLQRWMQVQRQVIPAMFVNLASVGVNFGLNMLLVHGWSDIGFKPLGFKGSALATAFTQIFICIAYFLFVVLNGYHKKTWFGWDFKSAFRRDRVRRFFIGQVLPLGVGACFDEWRMQVIGLFAGRLGKVQMATHSATLSVFFCSSAILYGLSAALTVRVARHLGAASPIRARTVSKYGAVALFTMGAVICVAFCFFHDLPKLYSSDPEVWAESRKIQKLVGFLFLSLSLYYAALASLNGQARPVHVAVSFLIGAWVVGVPLCYVLAFVVDMDLFGLWLGTMCSQIAVSAMTGFFVITSDWQALTLLAAEKAEAKAQTLAQASTEFEELAVDFDADATPVAEAGAFPVAVSDGDAEAPLLTAAGLGPAPAPRILTGPGVAAAACVAAGPRSPAAGGDVGSQSFGPHSGSEAGGGMSAVSFSDGAVPLGAAAAMKPDGEGGANAPL